MKPTPPTSDGRTAARCAHAAVARAKLNLYLHVVGRRDDGYHLLDSLVAFADIGDTVSVKPAETLALIVDGPFADAVPKGDDNLVLRAARALSAAAGVAPRAEIRLTKILPVASGIGGGSADAAATLRLLSMLWELDPDRVVLRKVAAPLGADVPMCLDAHPIFAGGIGDDVTAAPALPPAWVVLVNAGVPVLTPAVFRRRSGPFSTADRFAEAPADTAALACLLAARRNDLTQAALEDCPVVADVLAALAALPGALLVRMSGSGGTCFALYAAGIEAAAAARRLAASRPRWWVAAARLVGTGSTAVVHGEPVDREADASRRQP